jgi:hypothetical protein
MATVNWSMTAAGYPAHSRSGTRVAGISHMSTFAAMRFAEAIGLNQGWLFAEGAQPQLDGVRTGAPTHVWLNQMLDSRMVVQTEGLAAGTLVFAAGAAGEGQPLSGRSLIAWAEAKNQPWLEVIDNEVAYWGGLDDARLTRLLSWFLTTRTHTGDWRKIAIEPRVAGRLRHGLFDHGWTRNIGLSNDDRVDLWGGVAANCPLAHDYHPTPGKVSAGVRLKLSLGEFTGRELSERCPINDETGKARLYSGEF